MAKEQRLEQHIETIARWIIQCKQLVAFTGAGMSTTQRSLQSVA
jgi:hypothetical protein